MKHNMEIVLESINDALMALRETPSRPKDAFHSLRYASSWLKAPTDAFQHCTKAVLAECEDLLKLNKPKDAHSQLSNLQQESLVYVTKMKGPN